MNKQPYLAELQQLLVFMTEEDRELTVHHYAALFDQAGEAGEAELMGKIGSPTKTAIQLSRGYTPGHVDANLPPLAPPKAPEPEKPTPEPGKTFWEDLPDFVPPALDSEPEEGMPSDLASPPQAKPVEEPSADREDTVSPAEETPEAPEEKPEPELEEPMEPEPEPEAESEPDEPSESEPDESEPEPDEPSEPAEPAPESEPEPEPEPAEEPWRKAPKAKKSKRTKKEKPPKPLPADEEYVSIPRPLGIALLALVMVALGLPLAALFMAVMAALVVPGAVGLLGAYLAAVGGLWCLSFLPDAVMMFGLAFLILALGLIVLWIGLWADVHLARLYMAGVQWLVDELLERKVTDDE